MIPLGLAIAVSTLIGNLLGANDADSARNVAKFGVSSTFILSAVYGSAVILFRNNIAQVRAHNS